MLFFAVLVLLCICLVGAWFRNIRIPHVPIQRYSLELERGIVTTIANEQAQTFKTSVESIKLVDDRCEIIVSKKDLDIIVDENKAIFSEIESNPITGNLLETTELHIASPGSSSDILTTDTEYTAFRGFDVLVTTSEAYQKKLQWEGSLIDRNDTMIRINVRGTIHAISREIIREVKLAPSEYEPHTTQMNSQRKKQKEIMADPSNTFLWCKEKFRYPDYPCIFMNYEQLRASLPKFELKNLNDIFLSFISAVTSSRNGMDGLPQIRNDDISLPGKYHYTHDNHTYLANCYVYKLDGSAKLLCLKLANNGFSYPKEDELDVNSIPLHHGIVWARLNRNHMKDFEAMVTFAKNYLRSKVKVQLSYSFSHSRMDFKAFSLEGSTLGVVITFEEFNPVDGQFDNDDYWLYEDDDEEATEIHFRLRW